MGLLKRILGSRTSFGFDRIDAAVLAAYSAILAWTIAHHEQWFDESQAWLIARDSSLGDMLTHRLRYEGAPPLWHLILWFLTRMHVPFMAMNWVAAAFAVSGMAVFLRYAPLPRLFRILIPFTFFFLYQYAVIARSYVLFPLFVFLLCILYRDERPRVLSFAVVCALLTNLNIHGLLFSGCMVLLYAAKLYRRPRSAFYPSRRSVAAALLLYSVSVLIAVYVVLPPPDINFAIQGRIQKYKSGRLLGKLTPPENLPPGAPKLDSPMPVTPQPVPPMSRFQRMVWDCNHGLLLRQRLLSRLISCFSLLTYPLSSSNLIALAFLLSLGLWLWSRRKLVLLLPYFVLLSFETMVWTWVHHTGLLLIALLAAIWLASDGPQTRGRRWIDPFFATASLCVIITQIGWAFFSVHYDTKYLYDPGHVTHDFLVSHFPGKRIAAFTFQTPNVQPFSRNNLFVNQQKTYWVWSSAVDIDARRTEGLSLHPDVILLTDQRFGHELISNQWMSPPPTGQQVEDPMLQYWREHGYHETHSFCGAQPIRFGVANIVCELILERTY